MQHVSEEIETGRVGDRASDVLLKHRQAGPSMLPPVRALSTQDKPWAVYMVLKDG